MTQISELNRGETIKLKVEDEFAVWCTVLLANEDNEAIVQQEYDSYKGYYIRGKPNSKVDIFQEKQDRTEFIGQGSIET
jgi:hypothetical protein